MKSMLSSVRAKIGNLFQAEPPKAAKQRRRAKKRKGAKRRRKAASAEIVKPGKRPATPPSKVAIVSHPKCGRTWLAVMVSKVLNDIYDLDAENEFSPAILTKRIATDLDPRVKIAFFDHDSSCFQRAHRFSYLRHDTKKDYIGKDVILLVRDPRDVLVSSYHQIVNRDKNAHCVEPDLSRFVRDDVYGIRKLLAFYESWDRNRDVPASFTLLKYEDMHQRPADILRQALEVLQVADVDQEILDKAVAFSSFDNMSQLESGEFYKAGAMANVKSDDVNTRKVRKGKIGGYADELSADDIDYIETVMREQGCAFYDL